MLLAIALLSLVLLPTHQCKITVSSLATWPPGQLSYDSSNFSGGEDQVNCGVFIGTLIPR